MMKIGKIVQTSAKPQLADMFNYAILITYHNERELIDRAVQSALTQTIAAAEILIFDDASSEPLPALWGERVRIIRSEKNVGPAVGRNHLAGLSTAQYIHFLDADDELYSDWAATLQQHMEHADTDLFIHEVDSLNQEGGLSKNIMQLADYFADPVSFALDYAMLMASTAYRREFFLQQGGLREDLWQSEDWEANLRFCYHAKHISVVKQALTLIHIRQDSRSKLHAEVYRDAIKAVSLAEDYLDERYRQHVINAYYRFGIALYRMGETTEAAKGFAQMRKLGKPDCKGQHSLYKLAAHFIDTETLERLRRLIRPAKTQTSH